MATDTDRVAAALDDCRPLAAVQGDVAGLLAAVEAVLALAAEWETQAAKSVKLQFIDRATAADLVRRKVRAAILGEETPKPTQALPAVTVAVWPPGCGQPVCQHHYPGRPDDCVCPAWSDGGGYHIISESPTCTAHQVPGEEATTDGGGDA